jgi:hypothetical protein
VDNIGRSYLTLALSLERHVEGVVDAYFGPEELKAEVEAGELRSLEDLARDAVALRRSIRDSEYDAQRQDYLVAQTRAMAAIARNLAGEKMNYVEEVELYFDLTPEMVDESVFEAAHAEIDKLLPGHGELTERFQAWQKRLEVPPDRLLAVFEKASEEARRRTASLFDLPPGEEVMWELVEDKPWAAYNRYRGQYRSAVEVNTDLPSHMHRVLEAVAHEAYPGHHTEGAIKEHRLYRQGSRAEHAIQVLGPEAALAEGIAVNALSIIFSTSDSVAFLRDELCKLAGVPGDDAERQVAIARAMAALRGVTSNAALLLHRDGQPLDEVKRYLERYLLGSPGQVDKAMTFIQIPLWRSYAFNYSMGGPLVAPLLEGPDRVANFARLLSEPFSPTQVRQWVADRVSTKQG